MFFLLCDATLRCLLYLIFVCVCVFFYVINPVLTNCSDLLKETTFSFVYLCYLILFHIYIIPYFIQYYLPFLDFYNKYIDDLFFCLHCFLIIVLKIKLSFKHNLGTYWQFQYAVFSLLIILIFYDFDYYSSHTRVT